MQLRSNFLHLSHLKSSVPVKAQTLDVLAQNGMALNLVEIHSHSDKHQQMACPNAIWNDSADIHPSATVYV